MEDPDVKRVSDFSPSSSMGEHLMAVCRLAVKCVLLICLLSLSLNRLKDGEAHAAPNPAGPSKASTQDATNTPKVEFTLFAATFQANNSSIMLYEASDGFVYGTKSTAYPITESLYRVPATGKPAEDVSDFVRTNDNCYPSAPVEAADGNFYGVMMKCGDAVMGGIYRIDQEGTLTIPYSFSGTPDGAFPIAPLTVGRDGFLYGVTPYRGTSSNDSYGGTFFRLDLNGNVTVLHRFLDNGTGQPINSRFPLLQAKDGYLYGVSVGGGKFGLGSVYRLSTTGQLTVLHSFSRVPDVKPVGGLVEGADGAFYGLTERGGAFIRGSAYRITPRGRYSEFATLPPGLTGALPSGQLLLASDGNFYGVASYATIAPPFGNGFGAGALFRITPRGEYRVVHTFIHAQPHRPVSGVIETRAGTLMGITSRIPTGDPIEEGTYNLSLFTVENWRQTP